MGCCFSEEEITMTAITLAEYKTIKPFSPVIKYGKAVKVYDGDTIWVAASPEGMINKPVYRFNIRMFGYDSPELKSKNSQEKEAAIRARDALEGLLKNKILRIEQCEKIDKYGRILATIYIGDSNKSVNDWMVANGHGYPYNGGTKKTFI